MCDVGVDFKESNFYQNLVGTEPLHMPLDLFKKIADQTASYFPSAKLGYAFTEPLVYSHLYESLKYADSLNLFTSVTTNALSLRKWADKLHDAHLNELYISLDGPADIHNEIRGYKASFEKAVEGLEYLFTLKHPPAVSIFCVITQWNIGRLKEFADYFKSFPIKTIGFMHTNFTSNEVAEMHNENFGALYHATASNMQDIDLSRYDLKVLEKEIAALKKENYNFKLLFSPDIETAEQLNNFYHHPEVRFGKKCFDVFSSVMIKSNGDVIPAHGRCFNLTIGNIYQNNIREIWNSGIIARMRKELNKNNGFFPACSRCCSAFSS